MKPRSLLNDLDRPARFGSNTECIYDLFASCSTLDDLSAPLAVMDCIRRAFHLLLRREDLPGLRNDLPPVHTISLGLASTQCMVGAGRKPSTLHTPRMGQAKLLIASGHNSNLRHILVCAFVNSSDALRRARSEFTRAQTRHRLRCAPKTFASGRQVLA